MSDWPHNLLVSLMTLMIVGFTCLPAAAVFIVVAPAATKIAMGLLATGVAASVLLIAARDLPFTGQISISPELLCQIMPEAPAGRR